MNNKKIDLMFPLEYTTGSVWSKLPYLVTFVSVLWLGYLFVSVYYAKHLDLDHISSDTADHFMRLYGVHYREEIRDFSYMYVLLNETNIRLSLICFLLFAIMPATAKPLKITITDSSMVVRKINFLNRPSSYCDRYRSGEFDGIIVAERPNLFDRDIVLCNQEGLSVGINSPRGIEREDFVNWLAQNFRLKVLRDSVS